MLQDGIEKVFNSTPNKKVINALENNKNRKIRELTQRLRDEGVSGNEIKKQVYNLLLSERKAIEEIEQSYVILRKDKALLRKELLNNHKLEQLLISDPYDIITDISLKIPVKITKHKQYVEWITKKNLQFLFPLISNWELNKYYPCIFVKDNYAWISKSTNNVYRYFSKHATGHTVGLNWFDIIEIATGKGIGTTYGLVNARRVVANLLNHSYKDKEVEDMQLAKYSDNIDIIERASKDMIRDYPELYDYTKNYLHILEHLNAWGRAHFTHLTVDKEHVFYISTTHSALFVNRDQSIVCRAINLFAVLGLVNKIKQADVPQELLITAKEFNKVKGVFRDINFYTIPVYTSQRLYEAQKRTNTLKANMISYTKDISREKVEKAFGRVFTKKIFDVTPTYIEQMDALILKIIAEQLEYQHTDYEEYQSNDNLEYSDYYMDDED